MKRKMAAMVVCGCLAGGPARAQVPRATGPPAGRMPAMPRDIRVIGVDRRAAPTAPPNGQPPVFSAAGNLPGPAPIDEIKPPSIMLPDDPLDSYLLTKENGPFMVMAQVFRGPDSERMALALCKELRQEHRLPAYILRSKEFPMKSYIRGTPVQAPSETTRSAIKQPEQVRIHDAAAVLGGNEKTHQGSEIQLHKVKKLHPKCLDGMPKIWFKWREGADSHARFGRPILTSRSSGSIPGRRTGWLSR